MSRGQRSHRRRLSVPGGPTMNLISRCVVTAAFSLVAISATAQQSVLDQLRGGPAGAGNIPQEGSAGSFGQEAAGAGATPLGSAENQTPSITNRPRPRPPQSENADARRRVQQIELRQLHQQLDQFEASAPRNDFQRFVLQSVGRDLPLFGSNLFSNTPSTFAPLENAPVPANYVIGPGDEILVTGWGQINVDLDLFVERNGTVNIPRIGTVNVAGLKYQDLVPTLKTAFGRVFRNFELTATLGQLRSIQVFVVGQARRPGTYTVSSLSTLVTAIFAAGGPSSSGSMRSIQLKRDNRLVVDFDLYDLLIGADKSRDVSLMPGDIIQFGSIGPLVALTGAVNTPAIYELKQSTPLFDVVRWAGGLTTTAQGQKVAVERIEERKVRRVEEFQLDVAGLSKPLKDGDLVTVYSVTPRFDNAITLRGNVAQPGRFPWREGMRLRDLIPDTEALLSREYLQRRNQVVGLDDGVSSILRQQNATGTRLTLEDLMQRRRPPEELDPTIGDAIRRIQTESEAARFLAPAQGPSPSQAPRLQDGARPSEQALLQMQQSSREEAARLEAARSEAMRLVNQIRPWSHEVNWDYAVIERINPSDLSTALLPFNLLKAIEGDAQHNLALQRGDIVTIFSKDDLQLPASRKTKYVRLEGEFSQAGVYEIKPGETLRQLALRIGGLTPNAYLFGATFTRESTRLEQQKNIDEALTRLERDVQRYNIVRAQNVTSPEDATALKQQSENLQQLVARLRQVRATGRIVLELPPNAEVRDIPDITLEDGDRLIVPAPPSMVSVFGSVYAENSFIYKPQKDVADYLTQAGGPTRSADRSSLYVLRADGSVISKQQYGFLGSFDRTRLMPGDSIIVPEELDRTTTMRALKDIAQLFYQFGLGAAAIRVLRQ
jgi:polysaccharide biosynthesis/export protein